MLTQKLFVIGLAFLIVAFAGLVLISTRSFPKQMVTASVRVEDLVQVVQASSTSKTYTVQPGDTLMGISERLFNDAQYWDEIALLNDIGPPYTIHPGQELKLPGAGQPTPTDTPILPTDTPLPLTDTLVPPPTEIPTTESPTGTPTPIAMIEAEWPKRMEYKRSDSIRISLVRTTDQVFVPAIEIAGHTAIAASPIPVGTLEAPIEKSFGSEYKASACANLGGAAFKITPTTDECLSLEQPQITWEWNIMPDNPYSQTINASIQGQWKPIGGDGETIRCQIWRQRLDTFVEKPLITIDQLSVTSLFSGFFGSALSIPWLYDRVKERREKREKDEEGKPKIYLP